MKFSYLRSWWQGEFAAVNFVLCLYIKTIRGKQAKAHLACFVRREQHEIIAKQLTQSSTLMLRFRCICRRNFLNSLITEDIRIWFSGKLGKMNLILWSPITSQLRHTKFPRERKDELHVLEEAVLWRIDFEIAAAGNQNLVKMRMSRCRLLD